MGISDYDTKEKLEAIVEAIQEDDADDEMTEWEIEFIANQHTKQKENDVDFSPKEEQSVDEIFQKLWTEGYI